MKMIQSESKKFLSIMTMFFAIIFGIMANGCGGGGGGGTTTASTVAAPGAPENFTVEPTTNQGVLSATLDWDKPITGGEPTSYEIYRSTTPGAAYPDNLLLSIPATAATHYQYIDNAGLSREVQTYYVVAARNAGGVAPSLEESMLPSGGPGDPGEGFGNNLAAAMIFADGYGISGLPIGGEWTKVVADIDSNTGLRPTSTEVLPAGTILPYLDENTTYLDTEYYQQQTASTWQGQWISTSAPVTQHVTATWGDNLGSQENLTLNSTIRVEMKLTKNVETNMTCYNMVHLNYPVSGINEIWGTDGTECNTTEAIVYASTARLKIQKLVNGVPEDLVNPIDQSILSGGDGPGTFGAEVTVSGNFTYGFVWNLKDDATLTAGTYRITFLLDETNPNVLGAINNTFIDGLDMTMTPTAGWESPTEVYIDIDIAP